MADAFLSGFQELRMYIQSRNYWHVYNNDDIMVKKVDPTKDLNMFL